jgi:hypothetical protein
MRYSFLFSKIHLFSYLNVVGEGQIAHETSSPKNNQSKMDGRCDPKGRELILQA